MTDAAPPSAADLALQADAAPDLEGAGPSYYRLDDAAWAQIAVQYQSGATAKTLSALWRVSMGTIYRHAQAGGWTKAKRSLEVSQIMVARERERLAFAAQIAGEAAEAAAPREADPLEAAETLLRRGAGSALKGRSADAKAALGLAQDLLRCARLLDEVTGARAGAGHAWRDEDEGPEPSGWRDGPEAAALREKIIAGLERMAHQRGRTPPQHLPEVCALSDEPQYRPLATALGLVDGDVVQCPDFQAAVQVAQAAGRGEAVRGALTTPLPLEHCVWLSAEQKAQIAAEEAAWEASAGEVAHGARLEAEPGAVEPMEAEPGSPEPTVSRLDEGQPVWRQLLAQTPHRLSQPRHWVGGP